MFMNKRFKLVLAGSCLLCIVSLSVSAWLYLQFRKIGFVDTVKLVNEYQLKKELEKSEDRKLSALRSHADSLSAIYNVARTATDADQHTVKALEGQLQQLGNIFQQEFDRSNQEINEKVWTRLNADIQEYARKEGMQLIVGANGMGTVLYGNTTMDHTNDLIQFVNNKYQHGN
jgi:outer membrane protein